MVPVVQKVDNAIHRINHYPFNSAIGFAMTYPLDSDLSGYSVIHLLNNWGLVNDRTQSLLLMTDDLHQHHEPGYPTTTSCCDKVFYSWRVGQNAVMDDRLYMNERILRNSF